VPAACVLVASMLAGCGGSDKGGSASAPTPSPSASHHHQPPGPHGPRQADLPKMTPKKCRSSKRFSTNDIDITLVDSKFIPDCAHLPGSRVTIHLVNKSDHTAHTFTVPGTKVEVYLRQGEKGTAKLKADRTGQIRFYCRLHPAVMFGALFPTT
jgi:plastocyanin